MVERRGEFAAMKRRITRLSCLAEAIVKILSNPKRSQSTDVSARLPSLLSACVRQLHGIEATATRNK
jgi:hypothetical protein